MRTSTKQKPHSLSYLNIMMPHGLDNAALTLQCFIHEICRGRDFLAVYLHDVLFASSSEDEHKEQLRQLFKCFEKYGLEAIVKSPQPHNIRSLREVLCLVNFLPSSIHSKLCSSPSPTSFPPLSQERPAFIDGEPLQVKDANQPIPPHVQFGATDNLPIV